MFAKNIVAEKSIEWVIKTMDTLFVHNKMPKVGSVVYCNLAVVAEHTGIYVGNGEFVHFDGQGNVAKVGPEQFCQRLRGMNPAYTIFCPVDKNNEVIGDEAVARRALSMVGKKEAYNLVFHNCHCFVTSCLLGKAYTFSPSFTILQELLRMKYGFVFWRATNFNHGDEHLPTII